MSARSSAAYQGLVLTWMTEVPLQLRVGGHRTLSQSRVFNGCFTRGSERALVLLAGVRTAQNISVRYTGTERAELK